jgi:hypothetical protein
VTPLSQLSSFLLLPKNDTSHQERLGEEKRGEKVMEKTERERARVRMRETRCYGFTMHRGSNYFKKMMKFRYLILICFYFLLINYFSTEKRRDAERGGRVLKSRAATTRISQSTTLRKTCSFCGMF